jgi:hypothetical protein
VAGAVIVGIFVLLWALRIAASLFFFAFKIAIVVLVVMAVIRLYHLFSRRSS